MWPFCKKRTLEKSGFFRGFIDWHSHILPGVDDGVQTMEESLRILAEYERLGIKEVWLTPHIMEDMPNTTTLLRERFTELQAAYDGNVKLRLAAENMLDRLLIERLRNNDLLPVGEDGKYLLVETSYFEAPMKLDSLLEKIKEKGYMPILAHPERYVYMEEIHYRRIKNMRVVFQLNIASLSGAYGTGAQKKSEWLLKNGFYEICGTDIHRFEIFKEWSMDYKFQDNIINLLSGLLNGEIGRSMIHSIV